MIKIVRALLLSCFVLSMSPLLASHIEAGDLTYQCIGPHQYLITLNLYRDCNGIPLQDTARINYSSTQCSVNSSIILNIDSPIQNVTDTCPGHNSACHGGSGYGVEKHTYTGILNLPSGCGTDWVLSFRNCARNAAITTIVNPGNTCFYIKATLNNTLPLCDHSPTFLKDPVAFTCLNQLDQLNQGGYDADGDSLVYSLVASESAANTSVNYLGGYSAANPLSVTGAFGFSPSTGQMTFTPSATQVGIMKVLVSEYRGGVLIGTVERDMQVVVQNCSDSVPQISNALTVSGAAHMLSATTVEIDACTSGCFTFASSSANPDTSIHLTLSYTGQSNVPGATVTFSSGRFPTTTVCWSPTRANAGSHNIYITVKDNACPNPGQSTKTFTIVVPEVYPAGPDTTICQYNTAGTRGNDTTAGMWTAMSVNPATTTIVHPTFPVTAITGFTVPGRYNYIWSGSSGTCVDTMSVFVTAKPNAGPDQTICQYNVATMAATGSGIWHAVATNPIATTITDSTSATTTITGFSVQGTYNYIRTSNGCSDTAKVIVTSKPNAGPDQTICSSIATATMAGTGTGVWTADTTNPAHVTITNPTSPTTTITGLTTIGIYTFYWGNGCNDTMHIVVATQPNGGPDQTICQYTSVVMGATGAGTWTAIGGNPSAVTIANNTADSTAITGFNVAGTYLFTWSLGGVCTDTVQIIVNAKPNAGPDQTICMNSSATMAATSPGSWTSSPTNPAVVTFANSNSATSVATGFTVAGNYLLYWDYRGCIDTMVVTVNPKPNAGPDQSLCAPGTITMSAVGAGSWSSLASNPAATVITTPSSASTTVTGFTLGGTYTYVWTVSGCTDSMSVFVTPINSAGPDQTTCQYSTVTTAAYGVGVWTSLVSNPAATTFANNHADTTVISGLAIAGVYGYIWTNSTCSDTMYVTVTAKPDAGSDQTVCQYSTTVMAAVGAGTWSASAANPSVVVFANNSSASSSVSGFTVAGVYNLYWSVSGCADTVQIHVTAKPNAGADQTICQNTTTTMAATGSGVWTTEASNPAVITFANNASATTVASGFTTSGSYSLYWKLNGCSDTVVINVTAKPDAGADQTFCLPGSITTSAVGIGVWSALSTNPGATTIATPASATTNISGFTLGGTYSYVWTSNGCTDTMSVYIIPLSPAGPDQTTCQYTTVTTGAFGIGGTWVALGGNPSVTSFANAAIDTTTITGFSSAGTYGFIWTVNGCADTMYVTVIAKPDAGADQNICQYNSTTLAAAGTGIWSGAASNPVTVIFGNPSSPTSSATGFTVAGTYSLYWSSSGCTDPMQIVVTAKPNAGSDQTICQYTSTTLSATGTGTWTAEISNPAVVSFANATSATSSVSGFSVAGAYSLYWSQNGCTDTVQINVTAKPDAGPDQTICQGSSTTMAAVGTSAWTAAAGNPAAVTFANNASATSAVSGFTATGVYTFYWSSGGCADTMIVSVATSATVSVNSTAICPGQNATLTATVSVIGGTYSWSTGNAADTTQNITVSPAGTTTFTVTYSIAVCGSYTASGTVTVYPPLTLTRMNDTICMGGSASLTATPSTTGGSYVWSPTGGTTSTISVTPTATSVYTVTYNLAGCLPVSVNDTVNVTVPPILSLHDTSVCLGNAVTLTAVPSQSGGTYTWSPGGAATSSITVTPATTTTYTVSYAIPQSVCPPSTGIAIVTITPLPTVSVADTAICIGHDATVTAVPNITGGTYMWTPGGATTSSITISPTATTAYNVIYTIHGCGTATDSGIVTVNLNPTVSLTAQDITCYGYTNGVVTSTINPASGSYTYQWSNGATTWVDSNLAAGSYSLIIKDGNGCTASASSVSVVEPAQAFAEVLPADTTVLQGNSIQLTAIFTGYPASSITGYSWTPTGGLSCTDCADPLLNTDNATDTLNLYTVTVMYNNGCSVAATDTIRIESGIAIGNAFTPNGDGKNDVYKVLARGVDDFHLTIYNRWGQQVFEAVDMNTGWDGTYKGQQQPGEVYSYFLAIKYKNGQSLNKNGTLTLIR